MDDCCRSGFHWEGTPTGKEIKIDDLDVYIAGSSPSPNNNGKPAILFCHDGWGWQLTNNRLLVDHFAKEIGAVVYMPDFYHGTAVPSSQLEAGLENYDWNTWLAQNNADVRMPEILSFTQHLRSNLKHAKIAAVGYCWGGRIALRLGGKSNAGLVDCISFAHPSFITADEIRDVDVPVQILAPEIDPQYTPELKKLSNEFIPTTGLEYDYQYFPGMQHGFATRCNEKDENEKRALERAKNAVVYWFSNYLS